MERMDNDICHEPGMWVEKFLDYSVNRFISGIKTDLKRDKNRIYLWYVLMHQSGFSNIFGCIGIQFFLGDYPGVFQIPGSSRIKIDIFCSRKP